MPKVQTTRVFVEIQRAFDAGYTTVSEQGSARASKTYNTVIWIVNYALLHPGTRISIVRATFPAIKGSVLVDFKEIVSRFGVWRDKSFNKNDFIYTFDNGSWVEFFSCDSEQKLRGRKRDILYVNEANELSLIEWQQLKLRTTTFSIIDYNPSFSDEHWICSINNDPRTYHFITTYKDNPFLEQTIIDEIESLQHKNKSLWQVYGLGLQAVIEGLIFKDIELIDFVPEYAQKIHWRGMDFGFSCFTGDTLITTDKGQIRIADIKAGDNVLTRQGWKKVLQRKVNGYKEVTRKFIKFKNGQTTQIESTPEHLFLTNGEKWKKYKELQETDALFLLSHTKGENINDTQRGSIQITTTQNGKKKDDTSKKCYITQYGRVNTGWFLRGITYIISIITHLITTSRIFNSLRAKNTAFCTKTTLQNGTKPTKKNIKRTASQKKTGLFVEKLHWSTCRKKKECANIVGVFLLRRMFIKDFVLRNATINGSIAMLQNCKKSVFARIAERNFWETNILNQNAVAISALTNWQDIEEIKIENTREALVYDLWIEDCHEYFANGILVHNCDPTAIEDVFFWQDTLYVDEICYNTEMLTSDIIRVLKEHNGAIETISESADPRMIAEIYRGGVNIIPVKKYPGSIEAGIQKMLEYKIKITKRSTNIIKEFKNYTWAQDKEGKWLNHPIDAYNHAIDGIRYVCCMKLMGGTKKPLNKARLASLAHR